METDDFNAPVCVFNHGAHGFHPVSAIEVAESPIADHMVGRVMDVAGYDAVEAPARCERRKLLLIRIEELHGLFHLALDGLREGVVIKTPPAAVAVIQAVEPEQRVVACGAQLGHAAMVGRNAVESVSMDAEIAAAIFSLERVFLLDVQAAKRNRHDVRGNVVVIAAQIIHLADFLLYFLEQAAHKARVSRLPGGSPLQSPSIDDVSYENQFPKLIHIQKLFAFESLAVLRPEMQIGDQDAFDLDFSCLRRLCFPLNWCFFHGQRYAGRSEERSPAVPCDNPDTKFGVGFYSGSAPFE